jgi:hypothetical protein
MPGTADDISRSHLDAQERIRQRAEEIFRNRPTGSELEDWLQAEREVLGGDTPEETQKRANTVGSAGRPTRNIEELGEA